MSLANTEHQISTVSSIEITEQNQKDKFRILFPL